VLSPRANLPIQPRIANGEFLSFLQRHTSIVPGAELNTGTAIATDIIMNAKEMSSFMAVSVGWREGR